METAEELMLEESAEMTNVLNSRRSSAEAQPATSTSIEEPAAAVPQDTAAEPEDSKELTPAANKEATEILPPIRKVSVQVVVYIGCFILSIQNLSVHQNNLTKNSTLVIFNTIKISDWIISLIN